MVEVINETKLQELAIKATKFVTIITDSYISLHEIMRPNIGCDYFKNFENELRELIALAKEKVYGLNFNMPIELLANNSLTRSHQDDSLFQ